MKNKKLSYNTSKVITNKKLRNELSLNECALAIYLNGFNSYFVKLAMSLEEGHEQEMFNGSVETPFELDLIYEELLTACHEGELYAASRERHPNSEIHESQIFVHVDDLIEWLLKTKREGKNLVPSCLAYLCSWPELFEFYDSDCVKPEGAMCPTPSLALYIGENLPDESAPTAVLIHKNKKLRRENAMLKKALEENSPTKHSLLAVIAAQDEILRSTYITQEQRVYAIEDALANKGNSIRKRTIEKILPMARATMG